MISSLADAPLAELYSARPFIVVAAEDRDARSWTELFPDVTVYVAAPLSQSIAPQGCLALVAVSEQGEASLAKFSAWWTPDSRPAIVRLTADCTPVYREMLRAFQRDSVRSVDLMKEIVELRAELEQTRTVLDRMQANVQPAAWLRCGRFIPHSGQATSGPTLEIPVREHALGLAAIDVLVTAAGRGDGSVEVNLRGLDDGHVLHTWAIPYSSIKPGWLHLGLPEVGTTFHHKLQLELAWGGAGGPSISEIALRTWIGVPGLKWSGKVSSDPQPESKLLYSIPLDDICRAKFIAPAGSEGMLNIFEGGRRLRLHPVAGQIAIACIPGVCPAGLTQVSALGRIDHAEGPIVEYAMWVAKSADSIPAATWTKVTADGDLHPVLTQLNEPLDAPADLYFATRYAPRQKLDYAWADWHSFAIEVAVQSPDRGSVSTR